MSVADRVRVQAVAGGDEVPSVWLKAAVLGSLWASFEIVAGSFLHNMRIPFAGALLSAIGVSLLVSGHRVWPERGLLWRAALVCAVMKSVSPSAVIFGPMIAIFMEGLLVEIAVRVFGMNLAGYALGGALAVSWSLCQRVISYLITYGLNIVDLYVRLYEFAAATLRVRHFGPLDLVLALFGVHLVLGSAVALLAAGAGRRAFEAPASPGTAARKKQLEAGYFHVPPDQRHSIKLLALAAAGLAAGLFLISRAPLWLACLFVVAYIALASARYRRSLGRLKKVRQWTELAAIMTLSGLLLGGVNGRAGFWNWQGLLIGFEMTVRACLIVVGFAAISVELRNPTLVGWFTRRGMGKFSSALSVAFQALPELIATVAQERRLLKQPLRLLPRLLRHADDWLRAYSDRSAESLVMFLAGDTGEGKTTVAEEIAEHLRRKGVAFGGIVAPGFWRDGRRSGFDVLDLKTGQRSPLCRRGSVPRSGAVTPFEFLPEGLGFGRDALRLDRVRDVDVLIVDEVGPLELNGGGWAESLDALTESWKGPMLWVVRRSLIEQVAQRWLKTAPVIRDIKAADASRIAEELENAVSRISRAAPLRTGSANSSTRSGRAPGSPP